MEAKGIFAISPDSSLSSPKLCRHFTMKRGILEAVVLAQKLRALGIEVGSPPAKK